MSQYYIIHKSIWLHFSIKPLLDDSVGETWVGAEVGDVFDNGWAVDAARTQGPRSNSCGSRNVIKRFLKLQRVYDLYVSVCHPAVVSALTINGGGDVLLGARVQFWWSGSATNGRVRAKPRRRFLESRERGLLVAYRIQPGLTLIALFALFSKLQHAL